MNTLGGWPSWITIAVVAALLPARAEEATACSTLSWFGARLTASAKASATTGATARPVGPLTSTWSAPGAVPVRVSALAPVAAAGGSSTGGAGGGPIPGAPGSSPPKLSRLASVKAARPVAEGSKVKPCTITSTPQ